MSRADIRNVLKALGRPKPPKRIWQEPLDHDPGHYKRLCRLEGAIPDVGDLGCYVDDIAYMEKIQPDLFLFVLPLCLRTWQQDLTQSYDTDYTGVVQGFTYALARRPLLGDLLNPRAAQAVMVFMRDAILDRIDRETSLSHRGQLGSPYPWFYAIGSFAVIFPNLESLWRLWWAMETPGHAIGVLQYVSCLMYEEGENPIFAPWTPTGGGGPPGLWETDGHIYDECWQPANVVFFRTAMTPEAVDAALDRAIEVLEGRIDSEVPALMRSDFDRQRSLLEYRLHVLPEIVSKPLMYADWPEQPEGHKS